MYFYEFYFFTIDYENSIGSIFLFGMLQGQSEGVMKYIFPPCTKDKGKCFARDLPIQWSYATDKKKITTPVQSCDFVQKLIRGKACLEYKGNLDYGLDIDFFYISNIQFY